MSEQLDQHLRLLDIVQSLTDLTARLSKRIDTLEAIMANQQDALESLVPENDRPDPA